MAGAKPVLVLYCKRPGGGNAKQRLAAALGVADTLAIARLLLDCALEDLSNWPGEVAICPADSNDAQWASGLLERACRIVAQSAGNLGQRINATDARLRDDGHQRLIFLGSDCPGLSPQYLESAAHALETADVVLGDAEDGGVVLMGSRRLWPALAALPWSRANLGDALAGVCAAEGLSLTRLPPLLDVDTPSDLERLPAILNGDCRPARSRLAAWVKRWSAANRIETGDATDLRHHPDT